MRREPRSQVERDAGPDDVIRCVLCDWQLIGGEGITLPRPCCSAGLKFDLAHGLTLNGKGKWHE